MELDDNAEKDLDDNAEEDAVNPRKEKDPSWFRRRRCPNTRWSKLTSTILLGESCCFVLAVAPHLFLQNYKEFNSGFNLLFLDNLLLK